jgi:hypothetical protein
VSELGIQRFLSRKCTLGALNFRRSVARPLTPSSSNETTRVEASRATHEEGTVLEALAWGNIVEMSSLMGATGDSVALRVGGGQANEARP